MPIEGWLEEARFSGRFGRVDRVPFEHLAGRVAVDDDVVDETFDLYVSMIGALGLGTADGKQSGPYNLLLTREWMVLLPRRAECFEGISVNAIGFAGGLLVRTEEQLSRVREVGPLGVLAAVGAPRQ
jgi:ATP adenylyltransferase